jgi:hypothetical protein
MRPRRIAVLPLRAVGLAPETVKDTRRVVAEEVGRVTTRPVLDDARVDRVSQRLSSCRGLEKGSQTACAVGTGSKLKASHVVAGALGGLGQTHVVQLRVIDVRSAAVIRSLEETVIGSKENLPQQTRLIAARLFDPPRAPPWYRRWWVWAAAAGVVAAAVIVPLALTSGDEAPTVSLP